MKGFRAANIDVKQSALDKFATTSEANQWKIHKTGTVVAASANQIFIISHGLLYTPAYIAFSRPNGNSYYEWISSGGENYIDPTNLYIQLSAIGDQASYIIFKDFGA